MITLTQQERDKFAAWLEQEANSDDALARQAESIEAGMPINRRLREKAAMKFLLSRELMSIETVEIAT